MRIDLRKARLLCTAAEFELVAASGGKALESLGEARLKSKIARARALRDKYRDLHRRQRLAARDSGAKPARADANARTAAKAALFQQVLARFVERQVKLRIAAGPAQAKTALKTAAGSAAAKKTAAKTGASKASKAKRAELTPAAGRASAAAAGPAGPKPARSPKAPAPSTPLAAKPPPTRGFISERAAQGARNVRLKSMNARNVQAHIGSRGRRNQAKRDSRPR